MKTQGLQVLIVDDNSMNRKLISMLLKNMGCEVEEATGGIDCLELVCQKKYDVIFMDHLMPFMDGIETLNRMYALDTSLNLDTPVIALTADDLRNGKDFYLQSGFQGYLVKPVLPKHLEELIAEL
jgi:CheY-like chemotaxis protein